MPALTAHQARALIGEWVANVDAYGDVGSESIGHAYLSCALDLIRSAGLTSEYCGYCTDALTADDDARGGWCVSCCEARPESASSLEKFARRVRLGEDPRDAALETQKESEG